jgi:hypothetical protein
MSNKFRCNNINNSNGNNVYYKACLRQARDPLSKGYARIIVRRELLFGLGISYDFSDLGAMAEELNAMIGKG